MKLPRTRAARLSLFFLVFRTACVSPKPSAPPSRWRYLHDADVWHAAAVTVLAVLLSGGLVWLAYLVHVWRVAARSSLQTPRRMVVLVFGCRLIDDEPTPAYRHRLDRALMLARTHHTGHILLLGGRSGGRDSEAVAGERWLQRQRLPPALGLELEPDSTDSLENLRHARELLLVDSGGLPPVALVTSRYHLARCLMLSRRLGFEAVPVAAETVMPRDPRYLGRLLLESGYVMCMDIGLRWAQGLGLQRMASRIS